MITQVSLRNVRLFGDEPRTFQLKPLTVFCGSNSSGKSTILKILALLRQTQGIGESVGGDSGKLRFRGSQVDLGNYSTLVTNNDVTRNIHLGMRVKGKVHRELLDFLKYVKENKPGEFQAGSHSQDHVDCELDCSFEFFAEYHENSNSNKVKNAKLPSGSLLKSTFCIIGNNEKLLEWSADKVDVQFDKASKNQFIDESPKSLYKMNLPTSFFEKIGMVQYIQPQTSEKPEETTLIALLRGLLVTGIIADPKEVPPGSEHNYQRWPIPSVIDGQFELFKTALHNLHYVAPLRSPGKRYYLADLDVTPGMDPTGEFLPYILRDKGQAIVANSRPCDYGKQKKETLESALSGWLCYLRTGNLEGVEKKQTELDLAITGTIVELKLKSLNDIQKHSLADSGFGYSQVVPVIVRGLLVPSGGTLVVEQPELHLHPALQVRLADFFSCHGKYG